MVDKIELFSGRVQPGGADRYLNSHVHSVERTQCRGRAQNVVEGLTGALDLVWTHQRSLFLGKSCLFKLKPERFQV